MNHFSIGSWRVTQSRFYTTNDDDHLSAWTEKKLQSTSQSQTCTKTRSWSLFGDLLPIWPTTAFWILAKPLHLRSMLNRSNEMHWRKTAMPAASIGQQNGPNSSPQQCLTACHTTNASKVEQIGLRSFALSTIFIWPLTNQLPLLQSSPPLFVGKMLPQPAGGRKCFPRVYQIPKHGFLCYRNKQTYTSLPKMCWLYSFLF